MAFFFAAGEAVVPEMREKAINTNKDMREIDLRPVNDPLAKNIFVFLLRLLGSLITIQHLRIRPFIKTHECCPRAVMALCRKHKNGPENPAAINQILEWISTAIPALDALTLKRSRL
jgi:hypothetical protein